MLKRKEQATPELETETTQPDPLASQIEGYIRGITDLRTDKAWLQDEVKRLECANIQLDSEVQSLKITLDQERSERRHYHSLANETLTRLDVVRQAIDDVVKRAEHEVYRQRAENPRAEIPPLNIPGFLTKPRAESPATQEPTSEAA